MKNNNNLAEINEGDSDDDNEKDRLLSSNTPNANRESKQKDKLISDNTSKIQYQYIQ